MDPRLLKYYNQELQLIREMGAEFAEEFPKIAARLSLEGFECADPYVERLLEGFAFLAARIQIRQDEAYATFTQHLLEMVYPHFLAPTPSMAVVQLQPDVGQGIPESGYTVEKGSVLRVGVPAAGETACEYRLPQDLVLWPLEVAEFEYLPHTGDVARLELGPPGEVRAGLRLQLRDPSGQPLSRLELDRLPLFLRGGDETQMRLYEALVGGYVGLVARDGASTAPGDWLRLGRGSLRRGGFRDEEALLPHGVRSFQGYRLLQEYFAFPDRFMFVELEGLRDAVRRCASDRLDLVVLLRTSDPALAGVVDTRNAALHCASVVNLVPRRADRIHLDAGRHEYHIVVDRTRPLDFEVHTVLSVTGHGTGADDEQSFWPMYGCLERDDRARRRGFYTLDRRPRVVSSATSGAKRRSQYVGSEVYIALVDADEAPYNPDLRQLSLELLCTNRDLAEHLPAGTGDFTLQSGAPVAAVRCFEGPTAPAPPLARGRKAWQLISHLSLNYLSLIDTDERKGAEALRGLLSLYGDTQSAAVAKQIEGVRSVRSTPVTRPLPIPGPVAYGRGLEISLEFDESRFEGTGVFLLSAVLEDFFARYVSINSFTETVVETMDRGEIMRWPVRTGRRHRL